MRVCVGKCAVETECAQGVKQENRVQPYHTSNEPREDEEPISKPHGSISMNTDDDDITMREREEQHHTLCRRVVRAACGGVRVRGVCGVCVCVKQRATLCCSEQNEEKARRTEQYIIASGAVGR